MTDTEQSGCPHCPDGHRDPTTRPWAVWVATERDGDGQPTHLCVCPTNSAHVAESDAAWLRQVIRDARSAVARETAERTPHSEGTRPEPPAEHWKYRHLMSEGALWPLCRASGMTPWTTRYRREVDCPACLQILAAPPTEAPAGSGNIEPCPG